MAIARYVGEGSERIMASRWQPQKTGGAHHGLVGLPLERSRHAHGCMKFQHFVRIRGQPKKWSPGLLLSTSYVTINAIFYSVFSGVEQTATEGLPTLHVMLLKSRRTSRNPPDNNSSVNTHELPPPPATQACISLSQIVTWIPSLPYRHDSATLVSIYVIHLPKLLGCAHNWYRYNQIQLHCLPSPTSSGYSIIDRTNSTGDLLWTSLSIPGKGYLAGLLQEQHDPFIIAGSGLLSF